MFIRIYEGLLYWAILLFVQVIPVVLKKWLLFFGIAIIPNGIAILLFLGDNSWDLEKLWQGVGELGVYLLEVSLWTALVFFLYFLLTIPAARFKEILAHANMLTWKDIEITEYKRDKFDRFGDGIRIKSRKPFLIEHIRLSLISLQQERNMVDLNNKNYGLGWINNNGETEFTSFEMNNGDRKDIPLVIYGDSIIDNTADAYIVSERPDKLPIWTNTNYIATVRLYGDIVPNKIPNKLIRVLINYDGEEMKLKILEDHENEQQE